MLQNISNKITITKTQTLQENDQIDWKLVKIDGHYKMNHLINWTWTAIKEWNSLSTDLKNLNGEDSFKNKLKQELFEVAKKREEDDFIRVFNRLILEFKKKQ